MKYIDAPIDTVRKQIKRDNKNIRTYNKRKIEVAAQKAAIVLVAILWIFCICMVISAKAKPAETTNTVDYTVCGTVTETYPTWCEITTPDGHEWIWLESLELNHRVTMEMSCCGSLNIKDHAIINVY